ncbi:MAG: cupin domain-containing protein [Acidobacteria bacterium]|nr:cupin domain-containing protein [Acidobacteriota bacterium]
MKHNLESTFLRLRPDASIEKLPVDDSFWPKIAAGAFGDFHNEYLVTVNRFDSDWPFWERHPNGDEIVCLISGRIVFVLDGAGETELSNPGDFAFVPKGAWHTARRGPGDVAFHHRRRRNGTSVKAGS